jgi:hypothetical protein
MNETDTITIGAPLPQIAAIAHRGAYEFAVSWKNGDRSPEVIDLAPVILTHRLYRPLRDDPGLLSSVHPVENGSAVAWGDGSIDMAATTIERISEEVMTPADFRAWMQQHRLTYDAAAGALGISRRLVAYYASQRRIPRYIALACRYLDQPGLSGPAAPGASTMSVSFGGEYQRAHANAAGPAKIGTLPVSPREGAPSASDDEERSYDGPDARIL